MSSHAEGSNPFSQKGYFGEVAARPAALLRGQFSYASNSFPKGVKISWGVVLQWSQK